MGLNNLQQWKEIKEVLGLGKFGVDFKLTNKLNDEGYTLLRVFTPKEVSKDLLLSLLKMPNIIGKSHKNVIFLIRFQTVEWSVTELCALQDIVNSLNHPRTSDYIAGLISRAGNEKKMLGVMMEMQFCSTSLRNWLDSLTSNDSSGCSNDNVAVTDMQAEVVSGMIEGIKFLHSLQIVHGNLSPKSIYFAGQSFALPVKLGNYGYLPSQTADATTVVGMEEFMYSSRDHIFTEQSDLFSLGLIMWEVLSLMNKDNRSALFESLVYDGREDLVEEHPKFKNAKEVIVGLTKRRFQERTRTAQELKLEPKQTVKLDKEISSLRYSEYVILDKEEEQNGVVDDLEKWQQRNGNVREGGKVLNFLRRFFLCGSSRRRGTDTQYTGPNDVSAPIVDKNVDTLGINLADLELMNECILGTGTFAKVYRGIYKSKPVAVKVGRHEVRYFKQLLDEIKILASLSCHPNILKLVGYSVNAKKGESLLVLEYCQFGSLLTYIRGGWNHSININAFNLVRWSTQISTGMEFLHFNDVIHADICLDNVLLDDNWVAKICDFGLSTKCTRFREMSSEEAVAIPKDQPLRWRHLALETLLNFVVSTKSDVWSFGVLLFEMFSLGQTPYSDISWSIEFVNDLQAGMRLMKPRYATDEIYEIMTSCWETDPKDRPNFTNVRLQLVKILNDTDINEASFSCMGTTGSAEFPGYKTYQELHE